MKIRSTGLTLSPSRHINDAVVVVDDYHRSRFGLEIIGTDCTIVSTPKEGFEKYSESQDRIAIIDSRPEVFVETLELFTRGPWAELAEMVLVMPSHDFFSVHDAVSYSEIGDLLSIVGLTFEGELASVRIASSAETDSHSSVLVAGLLLGIESAHAVPWQTSDTPSEIQLLERKLLSLLESQDLIAAEQGTAPFEFTVNESTPDASEAANRLEELEKQLVTASTKLDSLQRKYDALASSRLGKITLKHWERNRRRSK